MLRRTWFWPVLLPGLGGPIACDATSGDGLDGAGGLGGAANEQWSLEFRLVSGSDEVRCGVPWHHVGLSKGDAEVRAFAFYLHDLEVIRKGGGREVLEFAQDGAFQSSEVALLDFDDSSGRCSEGTIETHTSLRVRGKRPKDIAGIGFTLGVPGPLNHLDLARAEAPLNQPEMYWSWQGGYKYLRLELESTGNPKGYLVHIGSMECSGAPALGYSCDADNRARIELTGDPSEGILVDLGALLAHIDVDASPDGVSDAVAGCMSNATDPECAPIYGALGLAFGDEPAPSEGQKVFRLP